MFPLGELNFHIIAVGTGITRDVILNNTSKCPVTYEIVLPPAYQVKRDVNAPPPPPGKEKNTKYVIHDSLILFILIVGHHGNTTIMNLHQIFFVITSPGVRALLY